MPFMDRNELSQLAADLNFNLIGFSKAKLLTNEVNFLATWVKKGYNAKMEYMERNFEKKLNVKEILDSAESVISLGINYFNDINYSKENNKGQISRYAVGTDYHLVIKEKINYLIAETIKKYPDFIAISYVDSGPVMDKVWAINAGLGWLGKNSNIINNKIGSWFFICNIITNYSFEYDLPVSERCGSCSKCIDACPTNAIAEPYVIDSNKCISYLTIENKGDIPEIFIGKFNNRIFGCDICQEVCPWNIKFSKLTVEPEFSPANIEINIEEVETMSDEEFRTNYKYSPLKRTKLKGLIRNAKFLMKK